jgi:CheY-like chemotaxis protein
MTAESGQKDVGTKALRGDGELIMVIDDEPFNVEFMRALLEFRRYRTSTHDSPVEALAELERTEDLPRLILLDATMPEMDGIEFCAKLKSHERLRGIPVIMVSGRIMTQDKIDAAKAGAIDYVIKPIDRNELLKKIQDALRVWAAPRPRGAE